MANLHIRRMLSSYELQDCLELAWNFMRGDLGKELINRLVPARSGSPVFSMVRVEEVGYEDPITKNTIIGYDVDITTLNTGSERLDLPKEKGSLVSRLIRELVLVLPWKHAEKLLNMPGVLETLYAEYKEQGR